MAREDLFTKYIALINQKQNIPPTDDNQPLQFITAPTDSVALAMSAQSSNLDPTTFKWGGTGVTPGWKWGQGRWG